MANQRTLDNAILAGQARNHDLMKKAALKWNEPIMFEAAGMVWQSLTPIQKEWYKANKPEIYRRMEARYKGGV
jgi:hypothetical protein